MKEGISNIIYKKLADSFETSFLTRRVFEKEFLIHQNTLVDYFSLLVKTYFDLRNSENPEIIKITKSNFVLERFNSRNYNNKYTVDDLEELKQSSSRYYEDYEEKYNRYLNNNDEDYVVSLVDFIIGKTNGNISQKENSTDSSIKYLFWDYFHNKYLNNTWDGYEHQTAEIIESPGLIVKKFEEYYLSNKYLILHDIAERNLSDENISPFDKIIVNVGKRTSERGRVGWSTTKFQILNNGKEYIYSHSAKDEKEIDGECINVFIFQTKYLIKISVTLTEVERTPYIIHRDCEKVSLRNDCELIIVKHHGNETIVFDTRKDALAMQTKLIEIREGRNNKHNK